MWSSSKKLETTGLYELDRQSQTRRRGCHCWEPQDERTVCVLRTNWWCMRWSSHQGLQHAFDRFSDACDQTGRKICTIKIEVLCLSRRQTHCILQVSGSDSASTCRRAAEKGGPFDTRADCVKSYYFSQLQTFIALYKMSVLSMQGRTALNIIEIANFKRSSCCATWRAVRYNIARTSCFENDDLSRLLHAVKFLAARATVKQNNTPSNWYWSRYSERMVDLETARLC